MNSIATLVSDYHTHDQKPFFESARDLHSQGKDKQQALPYTILCFLSPTYLFSSGPERFTINSQVDTSGISISAQRLKGDR
jgi:hypothetical protein